jgi:hypothetical protein
MNMLFLVIGLFALGAIIGLYLLTLVLGSKETPKGVALIHGVFVAAALIMLISFSFRNPPGLWDCVILFAIAATGGAYVFYRDMTGKEIPKWLAVVHGLIAVTGFVILLVHTF